jgi:hypothetical protein
MVAPAQARRTAVILVALLIAMPAGAPKAYAGQEHQTSVKRLWSQFPLGPHLKTPPVRRTSKPQPPRPSTVTHSQSGDSTSSRWGQTTSKRAGSSVPPSSAGSSLLPPWAWALALGAAAILVATIVWMRYPPRPTKAIPRRDKPAEQVIRAAPPPPKQHPWASGEPRTLDTLPRAELFAIAQALGIRDTVLMSREELIDVLRRHEPVVGTASSAASDRELARYAALYAAACRAGNPAPILAVTETIAPTIDEPATYSSQMVAEARRRGLLTSHIPGKPGRGELTARAKALLADPARNSPPAKRT